MTAGLIILISALAFIPTGLFIARLKYAPEIADLKDRMREALKIAEEMKYDLNTFRMEREAHIVQRIIHGEQMEKREIHLTEAFFTIPYDFWLDIPDEKKEEMVAHYTDALIRQAGKAVIRESGMFDVYIQNDMIHFHATVPTAINYLKERHEKSKNSSVFAKDCFKASEIIRIINSQQR